MRRALAPLLISATALLSTAGAQANWTAALARSEKTEEQLKELKWKTLEPEVAFEQKGEELVPKVTLEGTWEREGWNLLRSTKFVTVDPKTHEFRFTIEMGSGKVTFVELTAVGPLGEVEFERVAVYFKEAKEAKDDALAAPPKRDFVMVSAGPTLLNYKETGVADYSMVATTVKASYTRLLFPPRWDFAVNTFFNLFPITQNQPGVDLRFLGINGRIGYSVPNMPDPWSLSVMFGYYYITTFVNGNALGFENLAGPQFFPVVRRRFRNLDSAYFYLKYSPLTDGVSLSFLSPSNRELAFGGGYSHPLSNGHPLGASLDVSDFSFIVPVRNKSVSYQSYSLSVAYGL
jgi:hypothetical protein